MGTAPGRPEAPGRPCPLLVPMRRPHGQLPLGVTTAGRLVRMPAHDGVAYGPSGQVRAPSVAPLRQRDQAASRAASSIRATRVAADGGTAEASGPCHRSSASPR